MIRGAARIEFPVQLQFFTEFGRNSRNGSLFRAIVDKTNGGADETFVFDALQQIEGLFIGEVAVVDAIDAMFDRHLYALG